MGSSISLAICAAPRRAGASRRRSSRKYSDLAQHLPPLGGRSEIGAGVPYTQWEAWLALYHKKPLMIAKAAPAAPRGPNYAPTDGSRAAQAAHLARLKAFHRYPGCEFQNPDDLAKHIAYSAILDLLVEDYAAQRRASATSPKASSGKWPSASPATKRSISTA